MQLHASCVAVEGRGLLIRGASGAGKSRLALDLIALGASLVADDVVLVSRQGGVLLANAAPQTAGLIEAQGLGLLRLPTIDNAPLVATIDLDTPDRERLPRRRDVTLLGVALYAMPRPIVVHPASLAVALRHWPPVDPDRHGILP